MSETDNMSNPYMGPPPSALVGVLATAFTPLTPSQMTLVFCTTPSYTTMRMTTEIATVVGLMVLLALCAASDSTIGHSPSTYVPFPLSSPALLPRRFPCPGFFQYLLISPLVREEEAPFLSSLDFCCQQLPGT
jgi:hypothetical protein